MLNYKVKKGDNLSTIAYKYQTTVAILRADNPIIKNSNLIQVGWVLKIQTAIEYAKAKTAKAKKTASSSKAISKSVSPGTANIAPKSIGVVWKGLDVQTGQTGIVTMKVAAYTYTFTASGQLKALKKFSKNQKFRCFGSTTKSGGLYQIAGGYVKKSQATFEKLPQAYTISNKVGTSVVVHDSKKVVNKSASSSASAFQIPQLDMPDHRRTRMQVKKPDGKNLNMELRLLAFNVSHSNQYSANRTNAGWMINVGGKNLSSITLNGFMLDTKNNKEADDFIKNYHQYFVPVSTDKNFSSPISTILHKGREYKGFITGVNVSEQADNPVDRKFSLQFLVLKEKSLNSADIIANYPMVVDRAGMIEPTFLSSMRGMFSNTITGAYK